MGDQGGQRLTVRPDRLLSVLIGLGGAAIGAALVAALVLALGAVPSLELLTPVGEPLGPPGEDAAVLTGTGAAVNVGGGAVDGIVVDVAGAVMRPGLHRLRSGDRVGDAIEAAGGFAAGVDLAESGRSLNLAQPLTDGSKVLVPALGFDEPGTAAADDGRIDLNSAGQAELETLPGIGPVTAGKIVVSRSSKRFDAVRDLRNRGLVGESVFGQIKDLVRVGG